MISTSSIVDLPRKFSTLASYVGELGSIAHCSISHQLYVYLSCANQAMDMDDLVTFKFLRQTIVANIAQHNALKVFGLCEYDPVPQPSVEAALDAYGNNIPRERQRKSHLISMMRTCMRRWRT
jgi:hypothetical protein